MSSRQVFSFVFVRKTSEILLGLTKQGFGKDKWNGFGGKVEPGETIDQAAIRELKKGCGLDAQDLKRVGVLELEFEGNEGILEVHVFETHNYCGEIKETEEIRPQWFNLKDIPFKQMWLDDEYWFPYMLREELFRGYFLYRGQDLIVKYNIETVEELPLTNVS